MKFKIKEEFKNEMLFGTELCDSGLNLRINGKLIGWFNNLDEEFVISEDNLNDLGISTRKSK